MLSSVAIRINDITKVYNKFQTPLERLKQSFISENKDESNKFYALRNISFQVCKGERVGIIGRNGSGKSTLLQIISGILSPTSGEVSVNGRIAALLELGSGFNPEFTGRENIFLNASILGLSQEEIKAKFAEIVEFSEIEGFIDQPIKTYSSGMIVRLAFSVAVHVNPDILIVDEALAVGDVFFQRKCFSKIKELNQSGCTLLYVTHELANLKQVVDRAILLENGEQKFDGAPVDAVNKFYRSVYGVLQETNQKEIVNVKEKHSDLKKDSITLKDRERYGNQLATIEAVYIEDEAKAIWSGDNVNLKIKIRGKAAINNLVFGIRIKTQTGIDVFASNTRDEGIILNDLVEDSVYYFNIHIMNLNLIAGDYFLSLALGNQQGETYTPIDHRIDAIYLKILQQGKATGISNYTYQISMEKE